MRESNLGESGPREERRPALIEPCLGGICKDSPLARKSGRLGVFGLVCIVWSSFDVLMVSLKFGDGESFGVESDRERVFDGDLFVGVRVRLSLPSKGFAARPSLLAA